MLRQCCDWDVLRFRHKNHLERSEKCNFGSIYWFVSKNTAGKCPDVVWKIPGVTGLKRNFWNSWWKVSHNKKQNSACEDHHAHTWIIKRTGRSKGLWVEDAAWQVKLSMDRLRGSREEGAPSSTSDSQQSNDTERGGWTPTTTSTFSSPPCCGQLSTYDIFYNY